MFLPLLTNGSTGVDSATTTEKIQMFSDVCHGRLISFVPTAEGKKEQHLQLT